MAISEIFVTGATGLVGQALGRARPITALPRHLPSLGGPWWDPEAGRGHDDDRPVGAVVHRAGEAVAGKRWTPAHTAAVMESRVKGTRAIVDWLAERSQRPEVLVCASAIGFYGDCEERSVDEEDPRGDGFLAEVVEAWEREASRAEALGVRVVLLRIGVVLSPKGGALEAMLPAYKLGLGGPLGSGRQWFPWVHLDDVVGAIQHALRTPVLRGPVNVVAPGIVRQKEFARALGRTLHRPALLPAPAFALELAMPGFAREGLLASARVVPVALNRTGYPFRHPELAEALGDLLGV